LNNNVDFAEFDALRKDFYQWKTGEHVFWKIRPTEVGYGHGGESAKHLRAFCGLEKAR